MNKYKRLLEGILSETKNEDVIRMFANDSFPKDKMPKWGTANLKINKEMNGWSLINYSTPIVFRNDKGEVFFNSTKYSQTSTVIQNKIRSMIPDYTEVDEKEIRKQIM